MDSIAGQMSRARYRFNGTRNMPIVVRSPYGGGTKTPEMHTARLVTVRGTVNSTRSKAK
jgi:pyruvate dehydrogenase E1 component beta subunit